MQLLRVSFTLSIHVNVGSVMIIQCSLYFKTTQYMHWNHENVLLYYR